jgi:DNA-binding XRE family transcriptional regulator
MSHKTTSSPALFEDGSAVTYLGRKSGESVWTLAAIQDPSNPDPDSGFTLSATLGASTYRLIGTFLLARALLVAPPALRQELANLLRDAAADASWVPEPDSQEASAPASIFPPKLLAIAEQIEGIGEYREPASSELPTSASLDMLLTSSAGHYVALREALAKNQFRPTEGSPFPRARLEKGGGRGHAELRQVTPEEELSINPDRVAALAQEMWRYQGELSDHDADALDAVSACWIRSARNPTDRVSIFIDDILAMRGLKTKRGGTGRRGGFEPEQRTEVLRSLLHLQEVWLEIAEVTIYEAGRQGKRKPQTRALQSRAFLMTDRIGQKRLDGSLDVEAVLVTPGAAFGRFLFGPGRQLALLSANALRYDPYRQRAEKRLLRYLSWQWRIGASRREFLRVYRVQTLLEEIGLSLETLNPGRTRERLEICLDTLLEHQDIAGWQYDEWDDERAGKKGWVRDWLTAKLAIEAPETIKTAYGAASLDDAQAKAANTLPSATLAERLKQRRRDRNLSQLQAAEALGISQAYYSHLERGTRVPSTAVSRRVESWLGE